MTTNEPIWINGGIQQSYFVSFWQGGGLSWNLGYELFVRMSIFTRLMKPYKPAHTVLMKIYWGRKDL